MNNYEDEDDGGDLLSVITLSIDMDVLEESVIGRPITLSSKTSRPILYISTITIIIMLIMTIRVSCAVGLLNIQIYSGLDPTDLIRGEIIDPASGW